MKILDALLGRTKPAKPDLERLFRLPVAAITMDAALGLRPRGQAGVCFKPMAGRPFAEARVEIEQLLTISDDPGGGSSAPAGASATLGEETDRYGYTWVKLESHDFEALVNRAHVVNSTLEEHGYGPTLLCSVFAFSPAPDGSTGGLGGDGPGEISTVELASIGVGGTGQPGGAWSSGPIAYLIYLYKQGSFYPFVPIGREKRDLQAEALLANVTGDDLVIEKDKERWFPIWEMPIS